MPKTLDFTGFSGLFREFADKEKGRLYPLQQKGYKLLYVFIPASPPLLDAGGRLRYYLE